MMKYVYLFFVFVFSVPAFGQLQFATVKLDGQTLQNIPRYSWRLPFYEEIASLDMKRKALVIGGASVKNEGVIFNRDGDRFKYRAIAGGAELGFMFIIGENLMLNLTGGADYNFHYKEKVFKNEKRSQKEILLREWGSQRVNRFNYFARVGFGFRKGFFLYTEYYFKDFLNTSFSQMVNGNIVRPYEGLELSRFNIGLSFNYMSRFERKRNDLPSERGF